MKDHTDLQPRPTLAAARKNRSCGEGRRDTLRGSTREDERWFLLSTRCFGPSRRFSIRRHLHSQSVLAIVAKPGTKIIRCYTVAGVHSDTQHSVSRFSSQLRKPSVRPHCDPAVPTSRLSSQSRSLPTMVVIARLRTKSQTVQRGGDGLADRNCNDASQDSVRKW